MVDLMKFEDPFSPPGDQPDLNKLRTKHPLSVLGRTPVVCPFLQRALLLPGGVRGSQQRSLLAGVGGGAPVLASALNGAWGPFTGAAGWGSERRSRGWKAGSCRWGPAGRGGRAADPDPGQAPLAPTPRCCPPYGCSWKVVGRFWRGREERQACLGLRDL